MYSRAILSGVKADDFRMKIIPVVKPFVKKDKWDEFVIALGFDPEIVKLEL
jgi:hypothetical protein